MYTVRAATSGNPDFGQYAPISDPATIEAPTLDELRALVRGYMAYHQVGGGNWKMPPVYRDGKKIGNMSYNLRIWRGETAVDEPTNHDVIDWHEGKAMDETTMNCPECIVGELRWGYVRGIGRMMWECTDVGRGWNFHHSERSVTQYGYCGIAIDGPPFPCAGLDG